MVADGMVAAEDTVGMTAEAASTMAVDMRGEALQATALVAMVEVMMVGVRKALLAELSVERGLLEMAQLEVVLLVVALLEVALMDRREVAKVGGGKVIAKLPAVKLVAETEQAVPCLQCMS